MAELVDISKATQPDHKEMPLQSPKTLGPGDVTLKNPPEPEEAVLANGLPPVSGEKELIEGIPCTVMACHHFKAPVKPIGVSGGTAAFYILELSAECASKHYWIGKNVQRAKDEIEFYEKCLVAQTGPLAPLLRFTFEYAGVVQSQCDMDGDVKDASILIMRNLRDGVEKLRMLDLKIGEKTASSGWKGKSSLAALRQSVVDQMTNSAGQGFRLEGFDNPPAALKSMDPLLDFGGGKTFGGKVLKRATRVQFQRMQARDIFMHFIDVSEMRVPEPGEDRLYPYEWAEVVLFKVVSDLIELDKACRETQTPQKWIGSSVALAFDCERAPSRSSLKSGPPEGSVKVNIFDWGRSELNLPEEHAQRSKAEQTDRETYWKYYTGGISLLAWEAVQKYYHRFSCVDGWMRVTVDIYDFDSSSALDYIGTAVLHLRDCKDAEARMTFNRDSTVVKPNRKERKPRCSCILPTCCTKMKEGKRIPGRLYYSCKWQEFADNPTLKGSWRITLHKAEGLSYIDLAELELKADPVAVLSACESMDGQVGRVCHQQSSVKLKTTNPVWEEHFELPVARREDKLLDAVAPLGISSMEELAELVSHPNDAGKEAFQQWRSYTTSLRTPASMISTCR